MRIMKEISTATKTYAVVETYTSGFENYTKGIMKYRLVIITDNENWKQETLRRRSLTRTAGVQVVQEIIAFKEYGMKYQALLANADMLARAKLNEEGRSYVQSNSNRSSHHNRWSRVIRYVQCKTEGGHTSRLAPSNVSIG